MKQSALAPLLATTVGDAPGRSREASINMSPPQ
jgi:hypothetical protein